MKHIRNEPISGYKLDYITTEQQLSRLILDGMSQVDAFRAIKLLNQLEDTFLDVAEGEDK